MTDTEKTALLAHLEAILMTTSLNKAQMEARRARELIEKDTRPGSDARRWADFAQGAD